MNERKEIIVYGTSWCGDCVRSKKVLDEMGVAYTLIDIDEDPEGRGVVETLNSGLRIVPTIVFPDGDILVEPRSSTLRQKIQSLAQSGG